MHQKTKDIQKRYEGFLQTPSLWKSDAILNLQQFKINQISSKINIDLDEKLRLGKYIERFVSYQLNNENDISILCENVQIQQNKRTLGELDCIIQKGKTTIHLEVIYKFYLFDESVGTTEIDHFIGPNRKDSLLEKLLKLKEKQLPLLYSSECKLYLDNINLKVSQIKQQVYFKAQLFVPFSSKNIQLNKINKDCIVGFYINKKEMDYFSDCKFYLPIKKDWLIEPHKNVSWLKFNEFNIEIKEYMNRKFSPLCWLKKQNGEIFKIFITWW